MTDDWPTLARCRSEQLSDPFVVGHVDDFLPEPLFERLRATFVDPVGRPETQLLGRGKQRLRFAASAPPAYVESASPEWRDAVAAIGSRDFVAETWDWVRHSTPRVPDGPYADLVEERSKLRPEDLVVVVEFATMSDGAFLPPHTDSPDKVLSCVLYLAPPLWPEAWGGRTVAYRPRERRLEVNWGNAIAEPGDMTTELVWDFVPNRLFYFLKSFNSWHGVEPILAPGSAPRRSFNLSLAIRADVAAAPLLKMLGDRVDGPTSPPTG